VRRLRGQNRVLDIDYRTVREAFPPSAATVSPRTHISGGILDEHSFFAGATLRVHVPM
jgi:hypothetical protein